MKTWDIDEPGKVIVRATTATPPLSWWRTMMRAVARVIAVLAMMFFPLLLGWFLDRMNMSGVSAAILFIVLVLVMITMAFGFIFENDGDDRGHQDPAHALWRPKKAAPGQTSEGRERILARITRETDKHS